MSDTRIVRITASQAWAAGPMQFDMDLLPLGYRIDGAVLELNGTLNVPAAGITNDQLDRLLAGVQCDRRLNTDGLGSKALDWAIRGQEFCRPADIAVGVAQPIALAWALTWRDIRGEEANDDPPATDFYRNQTVNVSWATPTDILAALAVNAGTTAQMVFFLSKLSAGTVPTSIVMSFVPYTGQEVKLPAGDYLDIIVRKLDGAAITDAELGNVQVSEDEKLNILEPRTRLRHLVRSWNRDVASSPVVSDGVADGAEGSALNEASVQFAPIVHSQWAQKGTRLPHAEKNLIIRIDGTLAAGSARIYYRMRELRDAANVVRAGEKLWPGQLTGEVAPKTSSKNGVSAARGFLSAMAQRVGLRKRVQ